MSLSADLPGPTPYEREDILHDHPFLAAFLKIDFPLGPTLQNEAEFLHTRRKKTQQRTAWANTFLAEFQATMTAYEAEIGSQVEEEIDIYQKLAGFTKEAKEQGYFKGADSKSGDVELVLATVFLIGYELKRTDYIDFFSPAIASRLKTFSSFQRGNQPAEALIRRILEDGVEEWKTGHPIPMGIRKSFEDPISPLERFLRNLDTQGI